MFDLGWSELMIIAVLAVIVLGPKELPQAMRTMARLVRKLRLLAGDFQKHVDDLVKEADLDDLRQQGNALRKRDLGQTIERTIDPDGTVGRDLNKGLDKGLEMDPTGGPAAAAPTSAPSAAPPPPAPPAATAAEPAAGDGARPTG